MKTGNTLSDKSIHVNGHSVEEALALSDLRNELNESRVTYDPDFKGLEPIISLKQGEKQTAMLHKGGVSTLLASVKSGKTFLIWLLAYHAARVMSSFNIITHLAKKEKVAIFDTEQGKARCQKKFNTYFPGIDIPVDLISFRHLSIQKILPAIECYIIDHRPTIVFIDIGSDLIPGGVSDLHGSEQAVNKLSSLAEKYHMHVVISLHLSRRGEAMGHLGSVLLKRSECIFNVKKLNEYFVVKPSYTRDEPWKPWAFEIQDGKGVPVDIKSLLEPEESASTIKSDFNSVPHETHQDIIIEIFASDESLQPKEFKERLKEVYTEKVTAIGLELVKKLQRYYVSEGLIIKRAGLLYPSKSTRVIKI